MDWIATSKDRVFFLLNDFLFSSLILFTNTIGLNTRNSWNNLFVDLNTVQVDIGQHMLIMIVRQDGRVAVHRRESECGNSLGTQEATVSAAGANLWLDFQAPEKDLEGI